MFYSGWDSTAWIKAAEVVAMAIVGGFYLFAFVQTFSGLLAGRAKTPVTAKLALGRCFRHLAVLILLSGAIHSTINNLDRPFTFRSFAWIVGSWFAFLAWTILDRRRWEMEEP